MSEFPPAAKHKARMAGGTPIGRFNQSMGGQNLANSHPDVPPSYPQPAL